MEMLPITPARKAQLGSYAKEHGQTPAQALDDLLGAQLDAEQREYNETVQGTLRGYEDVKARRTSSAQARGPRPATYALSERACDGFAVTTL